LKKNLIPKCYRARAVSFTSPTTRKAQFVVANTYHNTLNFVYLKLLQWVLLWFGGIIEFEDI
jgi:hypothetical protein